MPNPEDVVVAGQAAEDSVEIDTLRREHRAPDQAELRRLVDDVQLGLRDTCPDAGVQDLRPGLLGGEQVGVVPVVALRLRASPRP